MPPPSYLVLQFIFIYIVMQNSISVKGRSNRSPPIPLPISITHSEERILRTSRCTFRTDAKHMSGQKKKNPYMTQSYTGSSFLSLFRSLRVRRRIIRQILKTIPLLSCPSPSFCPAPRFFISAAVRPPVRLVRCRRSKALLHPPAGIFLHR